MHPAQVVHPYLLHMLRKLQGHFVCSDIWTPNFFLSTCTVANVNTEECIV